MNAKRRLFRTDGIRGKANEFPMTAEIALALGRAVTLHFSNDAQSPRILVGRDTRQSGPMFENALASGVASTGGSVMRVGVMPTPAIAYLTASMRADAGVVISASHNPYQDNGIKFFAADGFKLPDETELDIERLVFSKQPLELAGPEGIGSDMEVPDVNGRYIVFLKEQFPKDIDLEGMRIAVDTAEGATYRVAPEVLRELKAEVSVIHDQPDGRNINQDCGAMYPQAVAKRVVQTGADIGAAFDGDGDRLILSDEKGNIVNGDHIMAICAQDMVKRGGLRGNAVVATVMSNLGLERFLEGLGVRLLRTQVGDRYVVQEMREHGYNLGGEQSGHLVFLDHATTGDGIMALLQVLRVMIRTGKRLSELAEQVTMYPQVLVNARVTARPPIQELPHTSRAIEHVKQVLGRQGRVLVRYSGTSDLIRVMLEGEDNELIKNLANEVLQGVQKDGILWRQ